MAAQAHHDLVSLCGHSKERRVNRTLNTEVRLTRRAKYHGAWGLAAEDRPPLPLGHRIAHWEARLRAGCLPPRSMA